MMAPILSLFIFYLVQYVLPSQCLFETSKFVKKGKYNSSENNVWIISVKIVREDLILSTIESIFLDVCTNHFIKLDKPERKMLASICETQCMIVCHETEGNHKPGSTHNIK